MYEYYAALLVRLSRLEPLYGCRQLLPGMLGHHALEGFPLAELKYKGDETEIPQACRRIRVIDPVINM